MRTMLPVCSMGGLFGDFAHAVLRYRPSLDFTRPTMCTWSAGAVGQVDVARAGGHGQLDLSVDGERALEGGFAGQRRKRRHG